MYILHLSLKTLNAISLQPFDRFWLMMHLNPPNLMGNQKLKNFKIQDDGRRLSWKSKNRNILASILLILTKFCRMAHINPLEVISWSKNQTFKNPRWWTAAILKIVKCDISATVWPISVKFGTPMYIRPPNMTKNFKIQDGGRRPSWK